MFKVVFFAIVVGKISSMTIQNCSCDENKFVSREIFEDRIKNITDSFTKLIEAKRTIGSSQVYFYVKMKPASIVYNKDSIVQFGEVLYNEGNHYNAGDSIFVAPTSGAYLFSWTVQMTTSKNMLTELRVANVIKERLFASLGSTGFVSFTRVVITRVNKGDHVWVQTGSTWTENYFRYSYDSKSSFMGVLLYEE